jgi:hypothetical protein
MRNARMLRIADDYEELARRAEQRLKATVRQCWRQRTPFSAALPKFGEFTTDNTRVSRARHSPKRDSLGLEPLNRVRRTGDQRNVRQLRGVRGRTMSDEFRSLDQRERAALEAALKRCRVLADQIESILRSERREFVDRGALADFSASLQRAADVLGHESRKSVEKTPAPAVMGSRTRGRQRHR